jgi:glycosyltransferase involved in cell wall biosynthesis
LIAVNRALVELFVKRFGVPPGRVLEIKPYALPAGVPQVELPQSLESFFSSHQPLMISMGWLEPEYDFALQIRALGPVRRRFPKAGLIILGEGRLGPELRAQIAAESYADHVLMPGDVPHSIALAAIARADIFLRTTLYDGDSISVREALHFGTPVIASDNGMRPPGTRLIPRENLEALVEAIQQLVDQGKPRRHHVGLDQENIHAVYAMYQQMIGE